MAKLPRQSGFLGLALAVYFAGQCLAGWNLASGDIPAMGSDTLDGRSFDAANLGGKPVLIYFWASWCPVCRAMQGSVQSLARDQAVFTVAMQSGGKAEVSRYMDQQAFHVPAILDEDGTIAARFGLRGVPAVFVVAPNGRIRFASAGYTSEWGLRARLWLAGRLDGN